MLEGAVWEFWLRVCHRLQRGRQLGCSHLVTCRERLCSQDRLCGCGTQCLTEARASVPPHGACHRAAQGRASPEPGQREERRKSSLKMQATVFWSLHVSGTLPHLCRISGFTQDNPRTVLEGTTPPTSM